MEKTTVSLSAKEPEIQLQALQKSRLTDLIEDKGLLGRVYEAGIQLLTSDALRACDEMSILGALYKAVSLNFRLEPEFGECYLIPRSVQDGTDQTGKRKYKSVCVFQIGYRGWKAMALQSGNVSFIESREVYKEDKFEFRYGTNAFLQHSPAEENSGNTTHFYARAKLRDSNEVFEVINKQTAEKSRRFSESQYDKVGSYPNQTKVFSEKPKGFWANGYAAMALRGPIKRLCAMLPLTQAIESGMQSDGTITYLQKDGTLTTISSVDVEKSAEIVPDLDMNGIAPEMAEKYLEVKDALSSMDFMDILKFYKEFNESDLSANRHFAKLFFEAVYYKATDIIKELNVFYETADKWQKDVELKKMLTDKKKSIEENAKRN